MKTLKALSFLTTLFSILISYAQHVDWIHAPKNPIPRGSSLQYQNLKGTVFQESISDYYTKDGQWFPYNAEFEIRRDNQGRVVYFKDRYSSYQYVYDNKGKLLEEKQDNNPYRVFEYDSKNRVVKTTYTNPKSRISTITYSYTQDGAKCTVNEIRTNKDGEIIVREIRYENGLEVYTHTQGFPATIYTYEYDAQGNWIVRTILDAETKQPIRNKFNGKVALPFTRSIIYHNEYEKGLQALTVQMTDLTNGAVANAPLVPIVFINGKEFKKMLFSRFINDFVFYDPLSKTYYIARNAYLGTYKKNQKIPVEILSTGAENVLLFNGLKVKALERGDEGELKNWNFINYIKGLGAFIGKNKTANKAYAFLNMPTVTNEKVVAVPGTAINDLWYIPAEDKKNVYLFENGEYVRGKYAMVGTLGNTTSLNLVVSVDGATTYVFPEYDKALEKHIYKARLFNPSTDVLKSNTANNNSTTSQNKSSTASCIAGNCADGYGTYTYESGAKVEGFFKNGKLNGYGEFIYANGDTYNGNYLEGQLDGYGIYHWKQKNLLYYGHWKDTKQHGYGYFVKNGETVEAGIYNEGKLITNLLTDFSNGKSSGNCLGNCTNGYGSITYDQGDVYEGLFKNGKPYKAGTYMWTNGNSYMGDWDESGKINYTGQFFTDTYVYKGAFAHNGFITGLGVKLDKKTNTKSYGEFKSGKLVVDYANSHTSAATTTNNSSASKQAEKAMITAANSLISLYYKSNSEFKKIVVKQHNNITQTMSIDKLNKLHALFIKHLFQLDKVVAHRYLLYLPNPYSNANTGKILTELSNEERTFMREESKRYSSQYKLKEQYVPKN